jgi:hypothetical protein
VGWSSVKVIGGKFEELVPLSPVWLARMTDEEGRMLGDIGQDLDGVAEQSGGDGLSVEPVAVGIAGVEDLVELADLVRVELFESIVGFGLGAQCVCLTLEVGEVLLDRCAMPADGIDIGQGLFDRSGGLGSPAVGAAPVAEAGLSSVVVRAPHRWSQFCVQSAFEIPDGLGIRLPCGLRGAQRGLEVG